MTPPSTDPPSQWQRTTTRHFLKWLFSWRTIRRGLIGVACLITVYALFCTEENILGRYAWDKYRRQAEARGEQFDFKAFIPKPVPDDQNFTATPLIQSWFVRSTNHVSQEARKGDLYDQAQDHIDSPEQIRNIRRFLDLPAWSRAFDVVRAGKMTGSQKFASGQLDLESRAKAAPSVLAGLKTNDAVFAEFRAASQRPLSRYPIDYSLENPAYILLPHLSKIRGACRRLRLKACAELALGQSDAALQDVQLILRLADSPKEEPFLISYLVRVACLQAAIQPVWEGLAERAWSEAQLQELQARLQSYNFVADLQWPLNGERAMGIAAIDRSKKHGLGELIGIWQSPQPIVSDSNVANILGRIIPSGWFDQEQLNYCRFFDLQMAGTFEGSTRRFHPDRVQSNVDVFDQAHSTQNRFDVIVHHRLISAFLLPGLRNTTLTGATAQTASDQAAIACALERYRLANGQFPDILDALAPQFISQLPHDVITGGPYKYHRTAAGQFVLYSVGWNEKDDGGEPGKSLFDEKEGDWIWQYPAQ